MLPCMVEPSRSHTDNPGMFVLTASVTTLQGESVLTGIKVADPRRGVRIGEDTPSNMQKRNLKGHLKLMSQSSI